MLSSVRHYCERASWCRVRAIPTTSGISFIVRHADVLNRMGVVDEGCATQTIFRPERLDLVHYRRESRRWLISTRGNALMAQYQKEFGRTFHGSPGALSPARRFSLDPLAAGIGCMHCPAGGAISYAVLKSVKVEPRRTTPHRAARKHFRVFERGAVRRREELRGDARAESFRPPRARRGEDQPRQGIPARRRRHPRRRGVAGIGGLHPPK